MSRLVLMTCVSRGHDGAVAHLFPGIIDTDALPFLPALEPAGNGRSLTVGDC